MVSFAHLLLSLLLHDYISTKSVNPLKLAIISQKRAPVTRNVIENELPRNFMFFMLAHVCYELWLT